MRGTKERFQKYEGLIRGGLGITSAAVAQPPTYDGDKLCPACKRPVQEHDRRQAHDCAVAVSP